ncbi:MAG: hypothetical protein SGJ09_05125 [Phycisphaerae bacterium]|nr:hypothetical protein [Phycisphaerae bacterium]
MSLMENLLTLYRVDSQVRALRSRVEGSERDLAAQLKLLTGLERQTQEVASQSRQLQATIKNLEVEAQGHQQRVDKMRGDMNTQQNNKLYQAMLAEIKQLETKKSEIETRAVAEMERLEQVKQQAEKLAAQAGERKKIHDVVKGQLEERRAESSGRLAELERERVIADQAVPLRERAIFRRCAETTEGEAMSEVAEIDRRHKEYACGACRIEIPFAHVAMLMSNANALVQCTSCTRILYLADATKEVLRK